MKERPILFSTPMVQAILAGRKTMTRRIVKVNGYTVDSPDESLIELRDNELNEEGTINYLSTGGLSGGYPCPYGKKGTTLWVRETFAIHGHTTKSFIYKADGFAEYQDAGVKWKPSIFMPRAACRILLEITNIKVERVADISEKDAKKEGIEYSFENHPEGAWKDYLQNEFIHLFPSESFQSLWQYINGKPNPIQEKINGKLTTTAYVVYPFNQDYAEAFKGMTTWRGKPLTVIVNPWVWCIEFKIIEKHD